MMIERVELIDGEIARGGVQHHFEHVIAAIIGGQRAGACIPGEGDGHTANIHRFAIHHGEVDRATIGAKYMRQSAAGGNG